MNEHFAVAETSCRVWGTKKSFFGDGGGLIVSWN